MFENQGVVDRGVILLDSDVKVSVIMPMHNVEDFIGDSIQSLISQSLDGFEIILIDDNSTDQTGELVHNYLDKYHNIRLINNTENRGVGAARNQGLKVAKGEYIFFMDADDLLEKNALKSLYGIAKSKNSDLVVGIHEKFNSKVSQIADIFEMFPVLAEEGFKDIFETPELFYLIQCWGKLYKNELIANITFPEGINYCEDQPFTVYSYLNAHNIYLYSKSIYYYRSREGANISLTQQIYQRHLASLDDVIKILEITKDYFNRLSDSEMRNKLFTFYFNRVISWNVEPFIRHALLTNNFNSVKSIFNTLGKWIITVDKELVKNTNGFQLIIKEANNYINIMDTETLDYFLLFLRNIKKKIQE